MKKLILLALLVLAAAALSACSPASSPSSSNIDQGAYVTGSTLNEEQPGASPTFFQLNFERDDQPYGVFLQGLATRGSLRAQLVDQTGSVVWQSEPLSGSFYLNTLVTGLKRGVYGLQMAWDEPVAVQYNVYTVPGEEVRIPQIQPVALLGGIGMVVVALGFYLYGATRKLGWRYMLLGGAAWMVTVALKFAWAIPFNSPIYAYLTGALPKLAGENLFNLYVGMLTGVFEVGLVWLLVRYTKFGRADWKKALAFAIGFGALEALLLGVMNLFSVVAGLAAPAAIPVGQLDQLAVLNNPLYGLAPVSERFFTIWIHILSNVLVFYAAAVRKPGYFWLAFAYKSLIDAVAAWGQLSGLLNTLGVLWAIEAVILVFGVIGWLGTGWVRQRFPALETSAAPEKELEEAVVG